MKLNKKFIAVLFLLQCFVSMILKAQSEADSIKAFKKANEWKKGYVVLENHTDTLIGYLKLKEFEYGYIEEISFRKDKDTKKGTVKAGVSHGTQGDIRFFGFENKRYKYFNFTDDSIPTKRFQDKNSFTGWVEIIEEGPINISLGLYAISTFNGGTTMRIPESGGTMTMGGEIRKLYSPMYCLKKGNKPTIIIEGPPSTNSKWDNIMLHELDERNKNHFLNLISDNIALVNEYKNKELYFGNIETIIKEYNIWSKNNH